MENSIAKAKTSRNEIVAAFGLPEVLKTRRLRDCPLGTVLIETARGMYIASRWERTELELKRAAHFWTYMRRHGLPVPVPVSDRAGRQWLALHHEIWSVHQVKRWCLQPMQDGNLRHLAAVGRTLARYHWAGKGYRKGSEERFSWERLHQLYLCVRSSVPAHLKRTVRVLDEEFEFLGSALEGAKLPRGPILGEVGPDRFCFDGNEVAFVLHCEPDHRGPFLFDLAQAVNRYCFLGRRYRLEPFEALVRAYDRTRPLALVEWDAFPNHLRFSALRGVCMALQKMSADNSGAHEKWEVVFQEWFERLRVLRRECEGGLGALLVFMATAYDYRRLHRQRERV